MKTKVLILGGTLFTGRILTERLLQRSDISLTLFNRGKTNRDTFANVPQLHGNREMDDINQVLQQNWDVVIDFSGYYPLTFANLLDQWSGKVGRYIFISTISVFPIQDSGGTIHETDTILACTEKQKTSALPDAYGEKKAEMERLLQAHSCLDSIILRPSFIYGRFDWTDRFYYWLYKAAKQQQVLVPEFKLLSLTYAEDLARGIENAITVSKHRQVYNAITHRQVSLAETMKQTATHYHKPVQWINATNDVLEKNTTNPSPFPLALPFHLEVEGNNWLTDLSVEPTPYEQSVKETIAHAESIGWPAPKAGLSAEEETKIIHLLQ